MLLFFDRIEVIRPTDVNPQYDQANEAVFNLIPDAFGEIKKQQYKITLNQNNKTLLKKALATIAKRRARKRNEFKMVISGHGTLDISGYTLLHDSKINRFVLELLKKNSLIAPDQAREIANKIGEIDRFQVVHTDASDLILSLIADHYARKRSLRSITNNSLAYMINALAADPIKRKETATMSLASSILQIEIPPNIEKLTPKAYVDLRKRYEDLREPFQHTVRTLCDDYKLAQVTSKKQFEDVVQEATQDFMHETKKLRRRVLANRIVKLPVIGLGVLSSLCILGTGTTVVLGAGVSAVLRIHNGVRGSSHATEKRRAQQLIGDLKSELVHPVLLRRIVI
jgi:hypothetical protein